MRKVAVRGLLARKTRLILTAFAVALGVTLIAGTYVFTDTINSSFDKIFTAAFKNSDVVVTPNDDIKNEGSGSPSIPAKTVAQVRALPHVRAVDGSVFDANAAILDAKGDPVSKGAPNFVASLHDIERFESFQVAKGHMPRGPDEVALDKSTADHHGFHVGGTVDIVAQKPRKTYRVVGLVQVAGVDSYGGAAVALMTLPEAQRITDKAGQFDQIDVAARPGTTPKQLRAELRTALPAAYDVRTGSQEADSQTKEIKDNLGFLQTALLAFAAISLFVGAFIIFNTFSITVAQRAREFALLRTLGASRAQVLRSVQTEGLLLGILGSASGLGLGIVVAKGLKAMFSSFGVDLPSQGTVVESRTIIVSLAVGIVVTIVASFAPALRATRVPPVAALREGVAMPETRSSRLAFPASILLTIAGGALIVLGLLSNDTTTGLSLTGGGAAAVFLGVALLSPKLVAPLASAIGRPIERTRGITGRLARENAVRQPGRTAVTAAALMIGIALVSFASIFAASANSTVSGYVDKGFRGDTVVQNQDGFSAFSPDAATKVKGVPGVATVSGIRFGQGRVAGQRKKVDVTGIDPGTFPGLWHLKAGGDALGRLGPGETVVKKGYADDHGIRVGQTLVVRTPSRRDVRLRVIGISDDKAGIVGKLAVSNVVAQRDFSITQDSYVFVGFSPGADAKATKRAIAHVLDHDFPQTEVLTADEFKQDQADQINQILGMIYALLALAIIVSLFGIVNTLVLSITERTRELGMLRAIGTSRRQLKRMIRYESVITATIGGVLGLVLGVVLSLLFTQALDDFKLAVPVVELIVLLVLSALAGVLAAALPARRAAKLDVLEALAYE